ncbi:hypothetical protein Ddc_04359 [Ditylenchus destructor]|nr:hypothetical protein Ddc_04359 [Ditylenchus destructor]
MEHTLATFSFSRSRPRLCLMTVVCQLVRLFLFANTNTATQSTLSTSNTPASARHTQSMLPARSFPLSLHSNNSFLRSMDSALSSATKSLPKGPDKEERQFRIHQI